MRRALVITGAALLVLAPAAAAKGPDQATITGPGLDAPIVLPRDAEDRTLGELLDDTGLMSGVFAQSPDPMLDERPTGLLGPRYTIAYRVPNGGEEDEVIRQELYPYAVGGPVTYMRPGQAIFGGEHRTRGGWFTSRYTGLEETLAALGFPKTAPRTFEAEPERRPALRWLPFALAGLLLPTAFFAVRRSWH